MPIKVLMPALSPTMTEGKLASWHKREGEAVASGDVLAEIETDKATMEVEAVDEGILGKIVVPEGTEAVAVNSVIAVLLADGEEPSAIDAALAQAAPAPPAAQPAPPAPATRAVPSLEAAPAAAPTAPTPPSPAPAAAPRGNGAGRIFASPLARRMAQQAGLDLAAITGSGPNGRIVKQDVEAALARGVRPAVEAPPPVPAPAPPPAAPAPLEPEFELQPLSSMRKTIARRLTEAKQTIPHFYLSIDCELDRLLELRKELNDRAGEAIKLSVNDLLIKAAALALRQVPAANASWSDDGLKLYKSADVSVAVAIDGGLITPVIRSAERKGLAAISGEMKELAGRAREGKLMPEEYLGGTFTLSNLGMYGVKEFAAVINPPQGCILAVGAGTPRPVVKDGALAVATVMGCTLSVDHRAVDGSVGAAFLTAFKKLVEDPLGMLL
jgi:pyruvate dehydrogenase E2 component (dihydrolipoamide acetyltransferase)